MDGLNEIWFKYGCNLHDLLVTMAFSSPGNINYWYNKHEVEHSAFTVSSSSGLVSGLGATGHAGPVYVIYPDHTFISTLPEHYANSSPPYYQDYIEQAGVPTNDCDPTIVEKKQSHSVNAVKGHKVIFNPVVSTLSISKKDLVTVTVADIKGRTVKTLLNGVKEPGEYQLDFDCSTLPSGAYFVTLQVGKVSFVKNVIVTK